MTTHTMSDWTDIGEQLRKAREDRNLELRDVAHSTRIPLASLTALEDSDYSVFPSPAYARSFLSQYSEFLNVDAHDWVEAFETGDVLSNVNDHGYLQASNEHIGEQQAAREVPQRKSRSSNNPPNEKAAPAGRGTSILQTLSVFLMTALFLGGGIYAYKTFEPQLMGAINEDEKPSDDEPETTSIPSDSDTEKPASVPAKTPKPQAPEKVVQVPPATTLKVPPLVVKTDPPKQPDSTTQVPPAEVKPAPPKPRTGPPPKAMVVEEEE